ncbi:MAG: preprotein translocase subunit SecA [Candidatus Parcubacteria bacterium]|nr:preprotein translocase subunit SecA [Candidatus Parcubacteria bacterium]
MSFISKIFGDANQKYLKKLQPLVEEINGLEPAISKLTDARIKEKSVELKKEVADGKTLEQILPQAFALVREAAKRTLGQRHFDVQLLGGIVLHQGRIAEMRTGEGKTLVATLPTYLNALAGQGVHIITVNDYLAKRDTIWMGQIHYFLGMSVACIVHDAAFLYDPNYEQAQLTEDQQRDLVGGFKVIEKFLRPISRREAYAADITYGTNNEFGFDYLRDNLVADFSQQAQRDPNYAIIDEVDSILIDEARTPLIISGAAEQSADLYRQLAALAKRLAVDEDYNIDEKMKSVALTEKGQEKMANWLGSDPWQTTNLALVHHVEASLRAETLYQRDKEYVVKDGEIIIVDEFTGRLMNGRRYSEGLHQAIEAKEGVAVKEESRTLATVTLQNYFRLYKKIAGMTGTAATEGEEFHKIYNLEVNVIPTNKPLIRQDATDKIFQSVEAKFQAVAEEARQRSQAGQPVLIGTVSIERNESLSQLLERNGVAHQMLNAKNHEREGQIIAQAGQPGAVTVATNMAGRGVDIILGGNPPDLEAQRKIIALGGLHVIGTERHESRRIDNQLRGRAGRQGDPGSSQFFISLDDDLMRIFGGDRIKSLMNTLKIPKDMPLEHRLVANSLEAAQRKVEGMNFDVRKHLLDYDDILNKHRFAIYKRRQEILKASPEKLREIIFAMITAEIEKVVSFHTAGDNQANWDLKEIAEVIKTVFPAPGNLLDELEDIRKQAGDRMADVYARDRIIKYLDEMANLAYQDFEKRITEMGQKINVPNLVMQAERMVLLQSIDYYWTFHLEIIENLKGGIGLRAYGQMDPLVEYKRESYHKFNELIAAIEKQVVYAIYRVGMAPLPQNNAPRQEIKLNSDQSQSQPPSADKKNKNVGRNDPCPCGSGKKYKKCHGK